MRAMFVHTPIALRAPVQGSRAAAGFTLVELMVVLAIGAILLGLAVPGLQSFVQSNQLTGITDSFATALSEARSQAAKLGTTAQLTAGSGSKNWGASPWSISVNQNSSGTQTGTLRTGSATPANVSVYSNVAGGLTFNSAGELVGVATPVEIVVCQGSGPVSGGAARMILVAPNGRVQISQNDAQGYPVDANGTRVSCQP